VTIRNGRKCLSEAELQSLLSDVRNRADMARKRGNLRAVIDELIVQLLVKAGLRPNELCALRIEDLPCTHGEMALWIRGKAGDIARKVSVCEELADRLTRFVDIYRNGGKIGDVLLKSEQGNSLGYMNIYNRLRRIGKGIGIESLSPSVLRRSYMIKLYDSEQDLRYVQEQAGYVNCRTIGKYISGRDSEKGAGIKDNAESIKRTKAKQPNRDSEPQKVCEACGSRIGPEGSKKIESGQVLCHECLSYFHAA